MDCRDITGNTICPASILPIANDVLEEIKELGTVVCKIAN